MNKSQRDDPLSGLRVPRVPSELRERVLRAAGRIEGTRGIWDRLWESRPLRLAWAVTTTGLLLAHAALSLAPGSSPQTNRASVREQSRELGRLLALPRFEISERAEALMGSAARNESKSLSEPSENEVKL